MIRQSHASNRIVCQSQRKLTLTLPRIAANLSEFPNLSTTERSVRMNRVLVPAILTALSTLPQAASAGVIYQSATLNGAGTSRQEVADGNFPGLSVGINAFAGVRFELTQPIVTEQVGGHFVGPFSVEDTIFGALVRLDGPQDFPDSIDLSTPDVLGGTLLRLPNESGDVFGDLRVELQPGWYGLVFGGGYQGEGLFGARALGAAMGTNDDIGTPSYFGYLSGFYWGPRLGGTRYVITGQIVPEPLTLWAATVGSLIAFFRRPPV